MNARDPKTTRPGYRSGVAVLAILALGWGPAAGQPWQPRRHDLARGNRAAPEHSADAALRQLAATDASWRASVHDGTVRVDAPAARTRIPWDSLVGAEQPTAIADVMRTHIVQTLDEDEVSAVGGAHGLRVAGDAPSDPVPAESGVDLYYGSLRDVNGDRRADVVLYEKEIKDSTRAIEVISGATGRKLWKRNLDLGDGFVWPIGDVTGDRRRDLGFYSVKVRSDRITGDCSSWQYCRTRRHGTFEQRLKVLDGATGRAHWSRSYRGVLDHRMERRDTSGGFSFIESYRHDNVGVLMYVSGDHDGDGSPHMVTNAVDLGFDATYVRDDAVPLPPETIYAGRANGELTVFGTTRAAIVGRRGTTIRRVTRGPVGSVAVLQPAGQVVGSSVPDLAWISETLPRSTEVCDSVGVEGVIGVDNCSDQPESPTAPFDIGLALLDGATLARVWRHTASQVVDGGGFWLRKDATGDGVVDFVMVEYLRSPGALADTFRTATSIVNGRKGTVAWRRVADGLGQGYPLLFTDVDGRRGVDVVLVSGMVADVAAGDDPSQVGIRFDRVRGSDGKVLRTSQHTIPTPAGGAGLYADAGADADGDGSGELTSGILRGATAHMRQEDIDHMAQAPLAPNQRSLGWVERGRDGKVLHSLDRSGQHYLALTVDFDGDRAVELETTVLRDDRPTYTIRSLRSAKTLWRSHDTMARVGNLDGQRGFDLLHATATDATKANPRFTPKVTALSGRTLRKLWSLTR